MIKQGSPGNGFGGGVEIGVIASPFIDTKHTERNTILNAFGGDGDRLYLGMMKMWQQTRQTRTPLIDLEMNGQVLELDTIGATLDYDIPYSIDPIKIRAYIIDSTVAYPGKGQQKFPVVLSDELSPGDTVAFGTTRSQIQGRISTDTSDVIERFSEGDGFVHQMYVASSRLEDYIPREYLQEGTFVFKGANYGGEQTNNYGSISKDRVGAIRHSYKTGSAEIGLEHTVTSYGDMMGTNITSRGGNNNIRGNYNYSKMSPANPDGILNYFNIDPLTGKPVAGSRSWVPTIIQKMYEELADNKEWAMTWSNGFSYIARGDQKVDIPTGWYGQVKQRGRYRQYNDISQIYNVMKDIAFDLYQGNNLDPYDQRIEFNMGRGAYIEAMKFFQEYALSNNKFMIVEDGKNPITKGIWSGTSDNLSFSQMRVTSVRTAELGLISIKHNPAMDFLDGDEAGQGFTGRYSNSSYNIWIEDVTDGAFTNIIPSGAQPNVKKGWTGNGNVVQLRPKGYVDTINFFPGVSYSPTLKTFLGDTRVAVKKEKGFDIVMNTWGEAFIKDASKIVFAEYVPNPTFY